MNDDSRLALDAETPVNPYSLLEAVNTSSAAANTAWLIFLALMAYLLVTLAGVTHKDLLLDSDIVLPILQVKINLTRFFVFAPILLVLLHLGLIGQLALLARKTLEFTSALRMLESTDEHTHPLRLELRNFFFVQAIAGPERSRIISAYLHGVSWLTLVMLPVLLLLYLQVAFLPYHDAVITSVHRLAVIADIALLCLIGAFLMRAEISVISAFWRISLHNPGSLCFAVAVLAAAAFFSLFVATIPGAAGRDDRSSLFAGADGALLSFLPRNLTVTDADLVADKDVTPGAPSLNLRGRDLRFAKLDRTDLHQADMTGANLDGASLAGADLRGIQLQCGDVNALPLTESRESAGCASARGADFARARLTDARMMGLDLRGARLEAAQLEGADLTHALMAGANFARAALGRADLSGGAALQGANFQLANLQGADLSGAKLAMADFTGAGMQGASLSLATLEGAVLRNADLEGANLQLAKVYAADLRGAKLHGADMAGAVVWRTGPPTDAAAHADVANIALTPPSEADMGLLKAALAGIESGPLRVRLTDLLGQLSEPAGPAGTWALSPDGQAWASHIRASEAALADGYRARLSEYLARVMCRSRFANGWVAAGVARRAMRQGFKGDPGVISDRLKAADCPASAAMPPRLLRDLAAAAETARGQ